MQMCDRPLIEGSAPFRFLRLLLALAFASGSIFLSSSLKAQGVIEDTSFHGRFTLGLSYGAGRTLASCLRLQTETDFDIARDDCGIAEGVFYFSRNFYRSVGNQVWARGVIDLHVRTNMERNWSDTEAEGEDALTLNNRNFYAETGNYLGKGETLWVGNRSYDYEDLWLLDLRLLDQHGPGLGVNQLSTPLGKVGLAFFRISSRLGGPTQDTLDFRISQIPLFEGFGKFVLIGTQTGETDARSGEKKFESMSGWQSGFIYQWESESLIHKWAVQYGSGLYGGNDLVAFDQGRGIALSETGDDRDPSTLSRGIFEQEREAIQKSSSFRIADQLDLIPEESRWSLRVAGALEGVDFGGLLYEKEGVVYKRGDMRTLALAARPAYEFSETYGLDLAWNLVSTTKGLGLKHRDRDGNEQTHREPVNRRLERISFGFLVRPLSWGFAEFRPYVAFNRWNREIQRDITKGASRDDTEAISGGLTMNMWW